MLWLIYEPFHYHVFTVDVFCCTKYDRILSPETCPIRCPAHRGALTLLSAYRTAPWLSCVYLMVRTRHPGQDRVTACSWHGVLDVRPPPDALSISIYNPASAEHDLHPFALLHIPQAEAADMPVLFRRGSSECVIQTVFRLFFTCYTSH